MVLKMLISKMLMWSHLPINYERNERNPRDSKKHSTIFSKIKLYNNNDNKTRICMYQYTCKIKFNRRTKSKQTNQPFSIIPNYQPLTESLKEHWWCTAGLITIHSIPPLIRTRLRTSIPPQQLSSSSPPRCRLRVSKQFSAQVDILLSKLPRE